ncbi:MAG: hypothetical protein JXR73_20010 [Candidatus Omnitrophica bacterium]|nr:hypothetical protein [Candidatus Omnitrophota bacterium]
MILSSWLRSDAERIRLCGEKSAYIYYGLYFCMERVIVPPNRELDS